MSRGFPVSKLSVRFSWILLGAIAIAIVLRIVNLGNREFWYDEVLSLIVSTGQQVDYKGPGPLAVPLGNYTALLNLPTESTGHDVLETIRNIFKGLAGDVHPPLSFLSLHFWLRLFGNSETSLRGLVALLSVGAIGSAYGMGRVMLGHRGGLLLAALLATNPYYLSHSLNIRMYGPLVLWTTLSAWAMLQLVEARGRRQEAREEELNVEGFSLTNQADNVPSSNLQPSEPVASGILWNIVMIAAVAAGLLTQYLFAYWVIALAIFVLVFDRRRWWQHGLRLATGVLLTIPWALWGTRQQLRNRPNLGGQFDRPGGLAHLQDVAQTLGTHLVLGDWATSLPDAIATLAGCVVILLVVIFTVTLWRQGHGFTLGRVLLLGIFPLLLALMVDVASGKFTVGFGWGRTMIFILPGCLLLLVLWLERAAGRWREPAAAFLLLLYLSTSVADLGTRHRWMFHQIADIIEQDSKAPTLIVMNSGAWGHVLRLAYYIPPTLPVMLLAKKSSQLAPALEKTLSSEPTQYQRLLWLDSAGPVWSPPSTEAQKQQVQQVLKGQFQLEKTQQLSGTMEFDQFTAYLYLRSASRS